jgi:hypothetical protein
MPMFLASDCAPVAEEMGLSLDGLAERSGLTASFLSLVERNMSNPFARFALPQLVIVWATG